VQTVNRITFSSLTSNFSVQKHYFHPVI